MVEQQDVDEEKHFVPKAGFVLANPPQNACYLQEKKHMVHDKIEVPDLRDAGLFHTTIINSGAHKHQYYITF